MTVCTNLPASESCVFLSAILAASNSVRFCRRQSLYDSDCVKLCEILRQSLCDSCYVKVCTILSASKSVRFCMRQSWYDSVCFKVCTGLAASKSVRYCLRQSLCDSYYVKVCTILPASKFVRFCLSQSITILAASMLLTSKSVLFSLRHSQTAELSATRSHIDRRTPFGRDTAGSLRLHSFAQWLHSLDEATPGPPCLTVTGTHRLTESAAGPLAHLPDVHRRRSPCSSFSTSQ